MAARSPRGPRRAARPRLAGRDLYRGGRGPGAGGVRRCAAYGPACREAIAHSLDQGDLRAIAFHERIGVGILPLSEVGRFGDPELLFFNVNTADDLALTDGMWRRLDSSPSSGGRTPERPR